MNLNKILKIVFLLASGALLYFNTLIWHRSLVGIFGLFLFLILTNGGYKNSLIKFFNFSDVARTKIAAVFFNFLILSYGFGVVIVFGAWSPVTMLIPFLLSVIISFGLYFWSERVLVDNKQEKSKAEIITEFPKNHLHLIFFFIILISGFITLNAATVSSGALTPWEAISKNYVYLIFLLILILAGLVLEKFKTGLLLFLATLTALLISSILPLTSNYIYGADGWRHIASEEQVLLDVKYEPAVYTSQEPTLVQKINPGRFSYAQFWGTSVALSDILRFDLMFITRWLSPVLWSVFFILFLFELGVALGLSDDRALLLTLLGLWPFALQAVGYFSLPSALGFLSFLFLLLLWVKRKKQPRVEQLWILSGLGVISFFGYILYFITFWLLWAISGWLTIWSRLSSRVLSAIALFLGFIVSAALLPALELIAGYSQWNFSLISLVEGAKQFLGNITAFYLASGPRPHIIDTGNIFFNQTPSYAFWSNALTVWRWWMVIVMILILIIFIYGLIKFLRSREIVYRAWGVLSLGLFTGYFISRYLLVGENILTRRLDALLALFFIVIVFFVCRKFLDKKKPAIIFILLLAVLVAASYSLGPISRATGDDEYKAAEFAWQKMEKNKKPCMVADTYPLLLVEALSRKQVIGGGFPIDEYFAQPELTGLYQGFLSQQNFYYFLEAKKISGAESCIFIVPSGIIKEETENFLKQGVKVKLFGDTAVLEI